MTEINLPSWKAFKAEIGQAMFGSRSTMGELMFRGQAIAGWPMQASFDRAWVKADKPARDLAAEYVRYLEFFRLLNARQGRDLSLLSSSELSALAQHYGMPTRLLDWSLSPYMAAFFAFYYRYMAFPQHPDRHVAIWAVDVAGFQTALGHCFDVVVTDASKNPRLSSQVGKFTYARSDQHDLGYELERAELDFPSLFWKIVLPASEAEVALQDLILMGISPSDIYPDFQGVADYVRLRMRFEGLGV